MKQNLLILVVFLMATNCLQIHKIDHKVKAHNMDYLGITPLQGNK